MDLDLNFSCYIVGEDSLALECATILAAKGHTIVGIVSSYAPLQIWATANNIPSFQNLQSSNILSPEIKYDFLFSIANPAIFPESIIKKPKVLAVNYHFSLLPKYAGTNAPSWAILNNEQEHGYTWHVISEKIDFGDIINQERVPITPDDTALSLIIKTYRATVKAFPKLIESLQSYDFVLKPQNPEQRVYYSGHVKPYGDGVIDWTQHADTIERASRALNLGHYDNPFASPKVIIDEATYLVHELSVQDVASDAPPGVVIKVRPSYIVIATQDKNIIISSLQSISGDTLNIQDIAKKHQLTIGKQLTLFSADEIDSFQRMSATLSRHEKFWIQQLSKFQHINLPYERESITSQDSSPLNTAFQYHFPKKLVNNHSRYPQEYAVITLLLVYFFRINFSKKFTAIINQPDNISAQFNPILHEQEWPLNCIFTDQMNISDALEQIHSKLAEYEEHLSFQKDIYARYAELTPPEKRASLKFTIVNEFTNTTKTSPYHFHIEIKKGQYSFRLFYKPDVFSPEIQDFLKAMPKHLDTMVEYFQAYPLATLYKAPILSKRQYKQTIIKWNKTQKRYPSHSNIIRQFEKQVKKTPKAIAIETGVHSYNYVDINRLCNQLANYLVASNVSKGDIVAILIDRSFDLITSILAVLKVGAIYLPIDTNYPIHRIKYILENSGSKFLITSSHTTEIYSQLQKMDFHGYLRNIRIDAISLSTQSDTKPEIAISGADPCYLMYTSGTTGKPKGVLVKHANVLNFSASAIKAVGLKPGVRSLQFASYSFDALVWELYPALLCGATLVLAEKNELLVGPPLLKTLRNKQIHTIILPPSVLQNIPFEVLPDLKTLVVGGEKLSADVINTWGKQYHLINAYGPTECTVAVLLNQYVSSDYPASVGQPIQNTQTYVLDEHLAPMPIGVVGELYVGGANVSLGYLKDLPLTTKRFIPNIFSPKKSTTLYRTGDLVRWLPNGTIDFVGRIDRQVKVRGFRIELKAIETHLMNAPNIQACHVTTIKKGNSDFIVAYIVTSNNNFELQLAQLKNTLKEHLPYYMVPNFFIKLERLPLSENGKIDANKLPQPSSSSAFSTSSIQKSPTTAIEKSIAHVWSKLLSIDVLSVDDNFFDIGGHSLLVSQMLVILKKRFNIEVPLQQFLQHPTISHIVKLIDNEEQPTETYRRQCIDAILDGAIRPPRDILPINKFPKAILLTGANGFLGVHILKDLLLSCDAKVYCLVRSQVNQSGDQRLTEALADNNLLHLLEKYAPRITILSGDLSQPKLGLSDELYESLTQEVDSIYHNGAHVHHVYNYERLYHTNVQSTIELIKLACAHRLKRINYISTISIAPRKKAHAVYPEEFLDPSRLAFKDKTGYEQTKMVSESLLTQAKDRGIPVNIYRPGWIIGSTDTGISSTDNNHLLLLMKSCIQIKAAPIIKVGLYVAPVNFVSKCVVASSLKFTHDNLMLHLSNKNKVDFLSIIKQLIGLGYQIDLISVEEWHEKLIKIDPSNALFSLLPLYMSSTGYQRLESLDITKNVSLIKTHEILKKLGIKYPHITDEILLKYYRYMVLSNFIESAPEVSLA